LLTPAAKLTQKTKHPAAAPKKRGLRQLLDGAGFYQGGKGQPERINAQRGSKTVIWETICVGSAKRTKAKQRIFCAAAPTAQAKRTKSADASRWALPVFLY
jgi:hypothetical protein